jgi:hypothetical protein
MLSHVLAGAVASQLRADVSNHVFALGKTSALVGTALVRALETASTAPGGQGPLRPAALILVDRILDMATPTGYDVDSLLQKVHDVLPRVGSRDGAGPLGSAHLHDVGVNPPNLYPPLDK